MNTTPPFNTPPKKSPLSAWFTKHRTVIIIVLVALLAAGSLLALLILPERNNGIEPPVTSRQKQQEPPKRYFSHLTGFELADEAAQKQPVTAVMIENSPDARPQSGLKKAGVVYEAVAEGGVTRFLALYQHDKPELIGPVRSLRMHYMEWAAPYQASIAHVGGSYNALETVRNGYRDIDQFFNASTYWRSSDRYAPHNVYTSGKNLDELNAAKEYTTSVFTSFSRTDGKVADEPNATIIHVDFSSALYSTAYAYNQESNSYIRSLAGHAHNDREEGQIEPNVIVVIKVGTQPRGGNDGYEDAVTTGSGQAYIFQNGTVTEAKWQKDTRDAPLQLLNEEGSPIALTRGQTWISAITGRGNVSWQ